MPPSLLHSVTSTLPSPCPWFPPRALSHPFTCSVCVIYSCVKGVCVVCTWRVCCVYMGVDGFCGVCIEFAYLRRNTVSRVQGRSRAGEARSLVVGSMTTTTAPGVLGRFPGPSVLDKIESLARLRWGAFSDFSKRQGEQTGGGCLTINPLPTSMELLPDPAETLCLLRLPRHPSPGPGPRAPSSVT